ncbi:MAG TPA: arsenate reductase ArsC [Campylobacterales bacterium]|nr:arsenate reductase ArsC [Campylobacterales bacterium]HIO70679.1 arsenate reductase ArsC [Campylobacterales bacterium]
MAGKKRVLILCTKNSCRSIMAEGLINSRLYGFEAESSGIDASGRINPNVKKILQKYGAWRDSYHSKHIGEIIDKEFDLVVTVCDRAKEHCPVFPKPVPKIHVEFEDPDGKGIEEFEKLWHDMEKRLLPAVANFFLY